MIDSYIERHPPSEFAAAEIAGAMRPVLTPFADDQPAQHDPPAAPRYREPDRRAAAMTPTRETIDLAFEHAYQGIAGVVGCSPAEIREAALAHAAGDYANVGFTSVEQEAEALNELALAAGWQGVEAGTGPVLDPDNEVARLAAAHPGMIDYGKASAALTPRQAPYRALPEVPMTDHQAGEILRLTGTDLRRPHHGAMAYAGTDEEKEAVG